jgi:hypothetical protein
VLLDGQDVAHNQPSVELANVAAGSSHQVVVEAPGRRRFVQDFVVGQGASVSIAVELQNEEPVIAEPQGAGKAGGKVGKSAASPGHARIAEPAVKPPESPPVPEHPAPRPSRAHKSGLLEDNPLR